MECGIFGYTDVIYSVYEDSRGVHIIYGYVYTKIGRKRIENGKIVTENGVSSDKFGYTVSLSECTALFGTPLVGEVNHVYAYIVDNNAYIYLKMVYSQIWLRGQGGYFI